MLRKFAVAMMATTLLVAAALSAEKAKIPPAPAASPATPAAPAPSDAGKPRASRLVSTGKQPKAAGPADVQPRRTAGTAPAAHVKAVKADKKLTAAPRTAAQATAKDFGAAPSAQAKGASDQPPKSNSATLHHRMHSRHYLVHRGRHPGRILASKGSTPLKRAAVHRPLKEGQRLVKTNQDLSGKATQ